MYKVTNESIQENHSRITYLRFFVLFCLASIGGGGGYFIYYLLNQMENEICTLQYNSVADLIQASIKSNFESKINTGQELAKAAGVGCPNTNYWPNCPYDISVLEFISNSKFSGARVSGFCPFVLPDQMESYVNFTTNIFKNDPHFPPNTGISSFGRGIYGINASLNNSDKRYHDITAKTSYGSKYEIATPVYLLDNVQSNYNAIMFNLHSDKTRGEAVDILFDCRAKQLQNKSAPTCYQSSLTDFIQPIIDNRLIPTTSIYSPIYPVSNRTIMTGLSYVLVYWDDILNITIPTLFPELIIVVETDMNVISYSFNRGKVKSLGFGDKHNNQYSRYKKMSTFSSNMVDPGSTQFHIIIYPTPQFCDYYKTNGPIMVLVGLICIMTITAIIFGLYDYLMKSESLLRKFLLESKRLFVRFISHELRTPLNAVSLGLQLIENDVTELFNNSHNLTELELNSQLQNCIQLLHEAHNNTQTAIVVLNDMLQYDKIESKSLQCECVENNIWEIIQTSCQELSLQAKASNVQLVVKLQVNFDENDEIWKVYPPGTLSKLQHSIVVGDSIKLGQVIRNLISNALKFSPSGSEVIVNAYWIANGLSDSILPKCSNPYQRNGSIRIEIIDQGPGMTKEGRESLFQEGVQLNPNQLQSGQGSGLGLWIAKGITTIHGGIIGVECKEIGKGSTFYVELPLINGFDGQSNSVSRASDILGDETYPLNSRTWRWNDPRNNLDPQDSISKKKSRLKLIESGNNIQKIIPIQKYSEQINVVEPDLDSNGNEHLTLTQKHIVPQIQSSSAHSSEKIETPKSVGGVLSNQSSSPTHSSKQRTPIKILIVDDAPSNRKLLCRILTNLGHICETASDGQECIDLVTKKSNQVTQLQNALLGSYSPQGLFCSYDLILMDSEMPVLNGPNATKFLRIMGYKHVIIIGVTGNVLPDDVEIFLEHGVDTVMGKPLNIELMWKEYDRILQDRFILQ